ncbi:DNA polymerase delta catalytic subunit [Olea europaea subsp. europaea]|uniref:DNA polymerase delta catalytic subunit n=1 Tax=Olea europaea subsp. europaea TaxID=158383 RepID=A0A8S0T456_OLEEU|nr:DNA polymerase delta catalytic subunit [Olea europaea subsp. europaea]
MAFGSVGSSPLTARRRSSLCPLVEEEATIWYCSRRHSVRCQPPLKRKMAYDDWSANSSTMLPLKDLVEERGSEIGDSFSFRERERERESERSDEKKEEFQTTSHPTKTGGNIAHISLPKPTTTTSPQPVGTNYNTRKRPMPMTLSPQQNQRKSMEEEKFDEDVLLEKTLLQYEKEEDSQRRTLFEHLGKWKRLALSSSYISQSQDIST